MIERGNYKSGAFFSECNRYRYSLWRVWDQSKMSLIVIGLNPSTADESQDDPTIRRCIRFASRDGYGGLIMLNLFALRSKDPKNLLHADDPIGPENARTLLAAFNPYADAPVAAWGKQSAIDAVRRQQNWLYDRQVATVHNNSIAARQVLRCFGKNKDGSPKHPLYLKADTRIVPLSTPAGAAV